MPYLLYFNKFWKAFFMLSLISASEMPDKSLFNHSLSAFERVADFNLFDGTLALDFLLTLPSFSLIDFTGYSLSFCNIIGCKNFSCCNQIGESTLIVNSPSFKSVGQVCRLKGLLKRLCQAFSICRRDIFSCKPKSILSRDITEPIRCIIKM